MFDKKPVPDPKLLMQKEFAFMPPERISPESDLSMLDWKQATVTASVIAFPLDTVQSTMRTVIGQKPEEGDYVVKYHDRSFGMNYSFFNLDTPRLILPRNYFETRSILKTEEVHFKDYDLHFDAIAVQIDYPFIWTSKAGSEVTCGSGSLLLAYTISDEQQSLEVWPEYWSQRFTASIQWGSAVSIESGSK
jgi:hypothetical protein